jgi:hypothetical protein
MEHQHNGTYASLQNQPMHSTHWSNGFWLAQFTNSAQSILPNIYHLFDSDNISHCLANFRIAAGLQEGSHQGPPFADGDFYKWLEGASYIYGVTKDANLKQLIDQSIKLIATVQREDGYIFTQYSIHLKEGEDAQKLGNSLNFEAYNLGHLITAGCVHFLSTGEKSLLKLGIKAASCLKALFEEAEQNDTAKTAICPSHYMALIDLYRVTRDKTHLETADLAIRLRDQVKNGSDDNQDRIKLSEHDEMLGHAVRATYLYGGVADLYTELGNESHRAMLERVWESEEYSKMYINSGCGALYDGVSPSGYAGDHPDLQRTHQSYGRPYELPSLTAYNETCATIGNIFLNWRLFKLNEQAAHADRIEQSFYNLILASKSLDGKRYFYSNPLEREQEPLPFHLKWDRTRSEYLSSFCCPPNMFRILSESSEYTYALKDDGIYTGIYGDCRSQFHIGDKEVLLHQETKYPMDGIIRFSFEQETPVSCTLHVRIPSWVKRGTLGTRTLDRKDANTYIPVSGSWKAGDEIILKLDIQPRIVLAHPLVEATKMQVAVMRGPVLYCSEEIDNNESYWPSLGLKSNAQFREMVTTIGSTEVLCLESEDGVSYQTLDWSGPGLYKDLPPLKAIPTKIRLIPYYAWDNRGLGGMKIWHPLYV